jgi:hypothetical protein
VQHALHDHRARRGQPRLEVVDRAVAPLDLLRRRELAHARDQHVLVVRAVEDPDHAGRRHFLLDAPEEVVLALDRGRRP